MILWFAFFKFGLVFLITVKYMLLDRLSNDKCKIINFNKNKSNLNL